MLAKTGNAKIIGSGMIAKSMEKHINNISNVVIFASGVSDSTCSKQSNYNREIKLLDETIKCCRGTDARIIYFSSGGAVYGNCDQAKKEDSLLTPATPYGHHKMFCEKLIIESGVDYLILRLPNIVGSNQNKKQLIPYLVDRAVSGHVSLLCNATRDLLDVYDFAILTASIINKVKGSDILNVATGNSVHVIKIFNEIQNLLGSNARVKLINGGEKHYFSIEKLRSILDVSFAENYWQLTLNKYVKQLI